MKKNNKTCGICGEKYTYCPNCAQYKKLPTWYTLVCSDNCNKIFNILCNYNGKAYDKEKAKKLLEECDLSKKANYTKAIREQIDEIMGEEPAKEEAPVKNKNFFQK